MRLLPGKRVVVLVLLVVLAAAVTAYLQSRATVSPSPGQAQMRAELRALEMYYAQHGFDFRDASFKVLRRDGDRVEVLRVTYEGRMDLATHDLRLPADPDGPRLLGRMVWRKCRVVAPGHSAHALIAAGWVLHRTKYYALVHNSTPLRSFPPGLAIQYTVPHATCGTGWMWYESASIPTDVRELVDEAQRLWDGGKRAR